MKVLIPMAGRGKRFVEAGYTIPKPLITVDGKPMIEHIVNNFSPDDQFIFGVNEAHVRDSSLASALQRIALRGEVISMPYQPGGVIDTLACMLHRVSDDEPVFVNYCDFSWVWNYQNFLEAMKTNRCDGAVVCYRGFHPHLLGPNSYATLRESGHWMEEIREKHSWHANKMDNWTSSGSYFFARGAHLKTAIQKISARPNWRINGEYYVSQLFQILSEQKRQIYVYEIPFMLQWGTPEDLIDYEYWSAYFRVRAEGKLQRPRRNPAPGLTAVILMAGGGRRFQEAGYPKAKPFIAVNDSTLVRESALELPCAARYLFVSRDDFQTDYAAEEAELLSNFPNARFVRTPNVTEGQAVSALLGVGEVKLEESLLIGACDHSLLYSDPLFQRLTSNESEIDCLVFSFQGNPAVRCKPESYGWLSLDEKNLVASASVKAPLPGNPLEHHAIVGAFWFRKARYFVDNARRMIAENDRINNEFYIDQCINYLIRSGLKVAPFPVSAYSSFGTPEELQTYQYFQRFFAQADFHPYQGEEER